MERVWTIKIVILGERDVGKSTLMMKIAQDHAMHHHTSEIKTSSDGRFNFTTTSYTSGAISADITLFKQNKSDDGELKKPFFKNAVGAIVIYDVRRDETDKVRKWIKEYLKYSYISESPILIVGNLIEELQPEEEERAYLARQKLLTTLEHSYPNLSPIVSIFTSLTEEDDILEVFKKYVNHLLFSLNLKTDLGIDALRSPQTGAEHFIPTAYILAFHEIQGSIILSKVGHNKKDVSLKELNSAMKIMTILDFENVEEMRYVSASFPWLDPVGHCTYIAFTIANPSARGGSSLYVIAFVWDLEIKEYILEWGPIIEGYLQVSMDEFRHFMAQIDEDFVRKQKYQEHEYSEQLAEILTRFRSNIISLVRQSLIKDKKLN